MHKACYAGNLEMAKWLHARGVALDARSNMGRLPVHEACTQEVKLDQGDMIVIDNLRVAHGRTPWSGRDRKMGMMISALVSWAGRRAALAHVAHFLLLPL